MRYKLPYVCNCASQRLRWFRLIYLRRIYLHKSPKYRLLNWNYDFATAKCDICKNGRNHIILAGLFEAPSSHRPADYRIFAPISFVSVTSLLLGVSTSVLRTCVRGAPAKYGGYRSNHSCTRVSPGTRVALRIGTRVYATCVSRVHSCVPEDDERTRANNFPRSRTHICDI